MITVLITGIKTERLVKIRLLTGIKTERHVSREMSHWIDIHAGRKDMIIMRPVSIISY